MHIRSALNDFILARQADGLSPKTTEWYQNMLAAGPYNVIDWLETYDTPTLEDVSISALRQYVAWMRVQPNVSTGKQRSIYTINGTLRCLHTFFRWCSDEYQLDNPMRRIDYPKIRRLTPKRSGSRPQSS